MTKPQPDIQNDPHSFKGLPFMWAALVDVGFHHRWIRRIRGNDRRAGGTPAFPTPSPLRGTPPLQGES